ncbi:MAG: alpha/beta fold hydrolase [Dehalococcoidia bacterium]
MGEFERDGLRLSYEEMGDRGAPPVVLLHEMGGESRDWYPVTRRLERSYHLVAPDLRGHGLSAVPEARDAYSMAAFTADLEALLDHLEVDLAALTGVGFGGAVALQLGVDRPERVAALCLLDTAPAFESDHFGPDMTDARAELRKMEEAVRRQGTRVLGSERARALRDRRLAAAVVARSVRTDPDGWLGTAHAIRTRSDVIPRLREQLTMPVLICGGESAPSRSAFEVLRDEIDDVRALTFRETDRVMSASGMDRFIRALKDFLRDVEEGRRIAADREV